MVTDCTARVHIISCYLSHMNMLNGPFTLKLRFSSFCGYDLLKWISYFSSIFLFQDSLSLSFLQFMPCWEGTRYWFLSLHDMQLLPGDNFSGSQVLWEKSGNKLSHMLWFFVHIKCYCPSSSMWPFYAFSLLPGLYFISFLLWFLYWSSVPIFLASIRLIFVGAWCYIPLPHSLSQAYTCSHYVCPICSKSLGDMAVSELFFNTTSAIVALLWRSIDEAFGHLIEISLFNLLSFYF